MSVCSLADDHTSELQSLGNGLAGELVRTPTPDALPPMHPGAAVSGGAGAPGTYFHAWDWNFSS